jgi:hypothetical protein
MLPLPRPRIRKVMKRITIYSLVVGLIFPFTQAAWGQQAGPVQPPPSGAVAQNFSGGHSAADVANTYNPIALGAAPAGTRKAPRWRTFSSPQTHDLARSILTRGGEDVNFNDADPSDSAARSTPVTSKLSRNEVVAGSWPNTGILSNEPSSRHRCRSATSSRAP